ADREVKAGPGMRTYVAVWFALALIVAIEVTVTYASLPEGSLLAVLLALAVTEAAIAVLYFMGLRYERAALFWTLIPTLVFVLLLLNHLWRDAFRLVTLSPQAS
ncbi:MAG TPA: cytochrome C oxidase subunit IV family protein, partial [Gemmatimonadales bacterium]